MSHQLRALITVLVAIVLLLAIAHMAAIEAGVT